MQTVSNPILHRVPPEAPDPFSWVDEDGILHFDFHRSQGRAMRSDARFVVIIAGTQGGKTCVGPPWLHREIQRRGPGDYLVVSPTYKLLSRKALPEFQRVFEDQLRLGQLHKTDKVFNVSEAGEIKLFGAPQTTKTQIFFGYAEDPDSLESATAKAAWLDEAGQKKFKLASWEAILRRLSLAEGRVLITTTPYNLGWLKQRLYDPWQEGRAEHVEVIRFESRDNPAFPEREWRRAKKSLPRWKFDLFYRAIFTRPAGIIYDAFDPDPLPHGHTCPRFEISKGWDRYLGLDFGGVNTAALFYARDPDSGKLYLYREYKAGGRTAEDHVRELLGPEYKPPVRVVGGAKSEGQWRMEFEQAGMFVDEPPVSDVEVGIDRVYGFHLRDELIVFDDVAGYLDEKATYSRKLDDMDQPTHQIEDKHSFHFMDAERYVLSALAPGQEREAEEVIYDYEVAGGFVA